MEVSKEKNTSTTGFTAENAPNAGLLVQALQHLGYDNYVAVCDIIDNCIDAEATRIEVEVGSTDGSLHIMIADNGTGMDKKTLDQALRLGSDCPHLNLSDLGKYGMGLSTAGMSLANRTTVLTRCKEEGEIIKSISDVDVICEQNQFVKFLGKAEEKEKVYFESVLGEKTTGTIVILEKCFGIRQRNVRQFTSKLIKEISRIFRKFMDKIIFIVNGEKINPSDPLMLQGYRGEESAEVYSDEDYEMKWKDTVTGQEMKSTLHVKLVLLPACSTEVAREKGINLVNQGFSILRNNREIAFGYIPSGWYTRHNSTNRIRGEISFGTEMDEAMGVDFKKRGIDLQDSIDNSLRAALLPQIKSMMKKAKLSAKRTSEDVRGHKDAEQAINRKSHLLILPQAKKGSRSQPNANVKFETSHFARTGPIFEADLQGRTIIIKWNVDHPFYDRFVMENEDNRTLVSSVDFLIYSLAAAQIQAMGDDSVKAAMIENIIAVMSANMRSLLD